MSVCLSSPVERTLRQGDDAAHVAGPSEIPPQHFLAGPGSEACAQRSIVRQDLDVFPRFLGSTVETVRTLTFCSVRH
jgi:hypothetical protein